jgi:hypothetical protein
MKRSPRLVAGAVAVLMMVFSIVAGCGGSSASTSRADAVAVARAEHVFLKAWADATAESKGRCETAATRSPERCFSLAFRPGARSAVAHFTNAIEGVLADGVGSKCATALEEALAEPGQIPSFPGDATAACRAESSDR